MDLQEGGFQEKILVVKDENSSSPLTDIFSLQQLSPFAHLAHDSTSVLCYLFPYFYSMSFLGLFCCCCFVIDVCALTKTLSASLLLLFSIILTRTVGVPYGWFLCTYIDLKFVYLCHVLVSFLSVIH